LVRLVQRTPESMGVALAEYCGAVEEVLDRETFLARQLSRNGIEVGYQVVQGIGEPLLDLGRQS
jgi:hypothetical protein